LGGWARVLVELWPAGNLDAMFCERLCWKSAA
jgi:hypothetical protein